VESNGRWHVGGESGSVGPLVGRLGADPYGLSAGLGMAVGDWRIDYSVNPHPALGLAHWVSFTFAFGESFPALRTIKTRQAYDEALSAYAQGHLEEARRALEQALRHDRSNAAAQHFLDQLLRMSENTPSDFSRP